MSKYKCNKCDSVFTSYDKHPCCKYCQSFSSKWLEDSPYTSKEKKQ